MVVGKNFTVDIKPEFFTWAIKRTCRTEKEIHQKFKELPQWIAKKTKPTFQELEEFAEYTFTPIGYFFNDKPPEDKLPIKDFRS